MNRLHYTLLKDPNAAYYLCNGRLTLTTGVPVTTSDVTGAGTIYFAPYGGSKIALYDGATNWKAYNFTELSLALTLTSGKPYDVFCFDSAGTPTLETLVWTNDTTRATALTTQNGVLVKSGATTRRYLGTIYSSGVNTTEDSVAKRYVWNYYNRQRRTMRVLETTDSWTYTTATLRQVNNAAANQLEMVIGVSEDIVEALANASASNTNAIVTVVAGIGLDVTNALATGAIAPQIVVPAANAYAIPACSWRGYPGVGRHFLAWLEYSQASGTTTWVGDAGVPTLIQSGISGTILA